MSFGCNFVELIFAFSVLVLWQIWNFFNQPSLKQMYLYVLRFWIVEKWKQIMNLRGQLGKFSRSH